MRTTIRPILSALVVGTALFAGVAGAAPAASGNAAARSDLSIAQVSEKVEAAGYSGITEIERERNEYEVKAFDKNGARVKLYVDARTGKILEVRQKNRDRD